jgi:O-antigen ligase
MLKRVGILLGLISIVTSPWTTYDPINPLKFLLLGICGCSCLAFLLLNRKKIQFNNIVLLATAIFISQALISAVFSESHLTQIVYGYYGRNFGLFSWLMLFAIMVYMSIGQEFIPLLRVFLIVGSISFTYSILQFFGKDPAPWENNFSSIIGFLGNPNFQSSLLGLYLVAVFGMLLQKYKNPIYFILLLVVIASAALLIFSSSSIQGLFVGAVGIASFVIYFLFSKKLYKTFLSLAISGLAAFVLFILAVINLGPLAPYIHKGSIASRGDYWLAALSMVRDNFFTGVGPDQFGIWYRFYRHQDALTRVNADVVTDSAHNGYLDIAANMGILALIAYLVLLIYAIISIGRYIALQQELDLNHATLVALFFGFQAQFLISPNQIGLVVWGWVFLGAIFGYNKGEVIVKNQLSKRKNRKNQPSKSSDHFSVTAVVLIGTLTGCIVCGPNLYANMQFRNALIKADALKIIIAANIWPRNEEIVAYSTSLLFSNNLQQQGLKLVSAGLKEFPNAYDLWRQKLQFRYLTESEKKEIQAQLYRLDPLNPEWAPKN